MRHKGKVSKAQAKRSIEKHREAVKNWYSRNKGYFRDYYHKNKDQIKANFDRYRKSKKGREAIQRYEMSPERRKAKTIWMREYRASKKGVKGNGKKKK